MGVLVRVGSWVKKKVKRDSTTSPTSTSTTSSQPQSSVLTPTIYSTSPKPTQTSSTPQPTSSISNSQGTSSDTSSYSRPSRSDPYQQGVSQRPTTPQRTTDQSRLESKRVETSIAAVQPTGKSALSFNTPTGTQEVNYSPGDKLIYSEDRGSVSALPKDEPIPKSYGSYYEISSSGEKLYGSRTADELYQSKYGVGSTAARTNIKRENLLTPTGNFGFTRKGQYLVAADTYLSTKFGSNKIPKHITNPNREWLATQPKEFQLQVLKKDIDTVNTIFNRQMLLDKGLTPREIAKTELKSNLRRASTQAQTEYYDETGAKRGKLSLFAKSPIGTLGIALVGGAAFGAASGTVSTYAGMTKPVTLVTSTVAGTVAKTGTIIPQATTTAVSLPIGNYYGSQYQQIKQRGGNVGDFIGKVGSDVIIGAAAAKGFGAGYSWATTPKVIGTKTLNPLTVREDTSGVIIDDFTGRSIPKRTQVLEKSMYTVIPEETIVKYRQGFKTTDVVTSKYLTEIKPGIYRQDVLYTPSKSFTPLRAKAGESVLVSETYAVKTLPSAAFTGNSIKSTTTTRTYNEGILSSIEGTKTPAYGKIQSDDLAMKGFDVQIPKTRATNIKGIKLPKDAPTTKTDINKLFAKTKNPPINQQVTPFKIDQSFNRQVLYSAPTEDITKIKGGGFVETRTTVPSTPRSYSLFKTDITHIKINAPQSPIGTGGTSTGGSIVSQIEKTGTTTGFKSSAAGALIETPTITTTPTIVTAKTSIAPASVITSTTTPISEQAAISRSLSIGTTQPTTTQFLAPETILRPKTIPILKQSSAYTEQIKGGQIIQPRTGILATPDIGYKNILKSRPITTTTTLGKTSSDLSLIRPRGITGFGSGGTPTMPVVGFPFILPTLSPGRSRMPSTIVGGGGSKTGFTPSLQALIFKEKGTYKPGEFAKTGLDYRPITPKWKIMKRGIF